MSSLRIYRCFSVGSGILLCVLATGHILPASAGPSGNRGSAIKQGPSSEETQGGLIYGDGWSFLIQAPPGWVMDEQAGQEQGVNAAFYRRGESWEEGEAV